MAIRARPDVVHHASEGDKFNLDTTLVAIQCPTCGITFSIPESLNASAIRWPGEKPNGWKLSCPLGHSWWYTGKSAEEKLRDERRRHEATRDLLRHEEASHRTIRGHLTRKKKQIARVTAGVCPCCNRTFQNLARHMKSQHPDEPRP